MPSPWTALLVLSLVTRGDLNPTLGISEIQYHPAASGRSKHGGEAAEWLEISNRSTRQVALHGVEITRGVRFAFSCGTVLEPGGACVVARDPVTFARAHPHFRGALFGPFLGRLANSGERIELVGRDGRRLDSVLYDDERPWPLRADGEGYSLERIDWNARAGSPAAWRLSCERGGTPGRHESAGVSNAGRVWIASARVEAFAPATGVSFVAHVEFPREPPQVDLEWRVVRPGEWCEPRAAASTRRWERLEMELGTDGSFRARLDRLDSCDLVRWRVRALDYSGYETTFPCLSDRVPHRVFFVPEPARSSVSVVSLVTSERSVEEAFRSREGIGRDYRWKGALTIEGRTFDDVEFRLGGRSTRFYGEKRSLRLRLARGDGFRGRRRIELDAARDGYGLGELLAAEIFRAVGIPVPRSRCVELRVVSRRGAKSESFGLYLLREGRADFLERLRCQGAVAIYEVDGTARERFVDKAHRATYRQLRAGMVRRDLSAQVDVGRYAAFRAALEIAGVRDLGHWNQYLVLAPGTSSDSKAHGRAWFLVPSDLNSAFGAHTSTNDDLFSHALLPHVRGCVRDRIRELRGSRELDAAFEKVRGIARSIEPVVVADGIRWKSQRYRLRASGAVATVEALIRRAGSEQGHRKSETKR